MVTLDDVGEAIGRMAERFDALIARRKGKAVGVAARAGVLVTRQHGRERIAGDIGVMEQERELARAGITKPNGQPIKLVSEEMKRQHEAAVRKYGHVEDPRKTAKKLGMYKEYKERLKRGM